MKKWVYTILLIIASCSTNTDNDNTDNAPKFKGEITWVKNFGGSGADTFQSIIKTTDSGYAILGYSNSTDGNLSHKTLAVNDYWLIKIDAEANLQWSKSYGGSDDDIGKRLIQTSDGGYALIGYSKSEDGDASNNEGFHDNWIIKLDANGNMEWEQSFGFSGHDHSYDVVQTDDSGFFFAGFLDITASNGEGSFGKGNYQTRHGVGEFWGTKLDANGNLQWRRYFGGTNNDRAHGLVKSNDGGFVLSGFSESDDFDISNPKGSYDFWVLKINSSGELVWEKSFGGTGIEISYDIAKTNDNSYVITGNTFSNDVNISKNNGKSDVWLIKIDDNGNLVWEKTYGGSEFDAAQSVKQTKDGGFLLTGNSKSNDFDLLQNSGENDIWILKTDANGNLLLQTTIGGTDLDYGFDALENEDGSILLVGETLSTDFPEIQSKGNLDAVLIRIE